MADIIIPKREDVPEKYTWDLSDIFESDEAWRKEYEALKTLPAEFEAFRGHLGDSAEMLLRYLRFNDAASVRLEKLYGYANCKSDQDAANAFYQDMRGKAVNVYVTAASAGAFATPEYIAIDDENHITLTESGREIAVKIYERHTLLTELLVRLGVTPEIAAEDACRIEHDISDETYNVIKQHIREHS